MPESCVLIVHSGVLLLGQGDSSFCRSDTLEHVELHTGIDCVSALHWGMPKADCPIFVTINPPPNSVHGIYSYTVTRYSRLRTRWEKSCSCIMNNVMHKFLIYLSTYFCFTCFGLSLSPSSDAGVQIRQWFRLPEYDVSVRALIPYHGDLNHWSLYNNT
jgi:hypothetical protein